MRVRHRQGYVIVRFRLSIALLALLVVAGCGAPSSSTSRTPVAQITPSPTATATILPTPTTPPTPKPSPTRQPSPTPTRAATRVPTATATATPSVACIPERGVQPVASAVIRSGATSEWQVSLTFDSDGGSPGNAARYLDILRAHGIHATWFLTGAFARANPSLVRQIHNEGQEIGNHTLDHPNLISPSRTDSFVCSELTQADRIISGIIGQSTRPYFRPPGGNYSTQTRTLAARLGYRTITWTIDPRDWDSATTAQDIENRVLNSVALKPGAIILMHVNSPHEMEALDTVIIGLEQRGYTIVPLGELLWD